MKQLRQRWPLTFALAALALLLAAALARADIAVTNKISDVRGTKHNLSAALDGADTPSGGKVPARTIKASSETQVCVFCHTPHEAESISFGSGSTALGAPLWNRKLSAATYTAYTSSSMDADATEMAAAPGGSSKLCLSCHDGTMAIDKVNALNGVKNATIAMNGQTTPVTMPSGSATTGFTRDLGVNLSNDHPISFTYDSALAARDGELRGPDATVVKTRTAGAAPPKMPLENGQVQCATCHDPHLRDKTASNGNAKFLRMNRFQVDQPGGGTFNQSNDIICLACHDKGGLSWAFSAHANKGVATQTYVAAAAQKREFPSSSDTPANTNPAVWQVACLNCHDTHTVQGARRLLREGTSTTLTNGVQDGLASVSADFSKSAIENTCYQCHDSASTVITPLTKVPDIKKDFNLTYRMPINSVDQGVVGTPASQEAHDIGTGGLAQGGKDFVESPANLGYGVPGNRHAECTDCHNPHRVVKAQNGLVGALTSANTIDKVGTHKHEETTGYTHSNIISGVLRGSFGVEPIYPDAKFDSMPSSFTPKRGDPGSSALNDAGQTYVTREYQICLKCHSNYGYNDDNIYPVSGINRRPTLGGLNRTPANTNGQTNFTTYTNQAKEFQAPGGHAGESSGVTGGGVSPTYEGGTQYNHRSWHPVMNPTGRTIALRNIKNGNPWRSPWNNSVGSNTMYCTDCHGSGVATTSNSVIPTGGDDGNAWGPHGSDNKYLLKANWDLNTGNANATDLCFKCHDPAIYRSTSEQNTASVAKSGFSGGKADNLHGLHGKRMNRVIKCNWCHVAVPHGWKNKALLVNLRDLGPEVGYVDNPATTGVNEAYGNAAPAGPYTNGPYYNGAVLRVTSFAQSGKWEEGNCGGKDYMRGTMCSNLP